MDIENESLIASVRAAVGAGANVEAINAASVTPEMLQSAFPAACAALISAAAVTERTRIAGIQECAFPGQGKLVGELIASGASVGDAALRLNQAERALAAGRLTAIKDADTLLAGITAAPQTGLKATEAEAAAALASASTATTGTAESWTKDYAANAKLQSEFAEAADYVAFMKAGPRARILGAKS